MDNGLRHPLLYGLICMAALLPPVFSQCTTGKTGPGCVKYNLAYGKTTSQKYEWRTYESSRFPVDDNMTSCSQTTTLQDPWWQVNLGKDMYVDGAVFYINQSTLQTLKTYTLEVQADNKTWQTCYDYTTDGAIYSPLRITCVRPLLGKMVRFTVYHEQINLEICHVGVYGSCNDGSYGNYCENNCGHCDLNFTVCDKNTGRCPRGCDEGYAGSTCKEDCPFKTYGEDCGHTCGECRNNQTCNKFTGICPDELCDIAWQPPYCNKTCKDGTFGFGCKECGACLGGVPCNKTSGNCMNGACDPGYLFIKHHTENCLKECDDFTWGNKCSKVCGKCFNNISSIPGPCNKTNGVCMFGCSDGYQHDANNYCENECPDNSWGKNCVNSCGNCGRKLTDRELQNRTDGVTVVPTICGKRDGTCYTGCIPGWQGVHCTDKCTPGTYGKDCVKLCGHCKGVCDSLTALCPGDCEDGYTGTRCNVACPIGYYGYKCQTKCPVNCATNCTITDGTCICKDGWMGLKCSEVCPPNHYGKDCATPCGNCRSGTSCTQGTGYCTDGCEPDWTGLKCNDKVIHETYERSYGDIIGGVIGGVIALALICTFAGWVIWRYHHDKSIHVRELASSLRRISLRGSKNLRRSIQRLSMRMKRGGGNDQQRLGTGAEAPAQHTHKARSNHSRMYECVKLQSNVIHYDDFTRLHLQLQETRSGGRTLLYDAYESFLSQRPRDRTAESNGHAGVENKGFYNTGVDDVHLEFDEGKNRIPEFLPLGSNLSGFLLLNMPAVSAELWNHLQQRQIETIVSIGKEASFNWKPGERMSIGHDVVDCVDVMMYGSHRESKLTVQRRGVPGRRAIRHLECFFCNPADPFPNISTLLMFVERFQQLHHTQKERSVVVNYVHMHDQAILITLVASCLEILKETKRVDILRTVAIGGNPSAKSIRTFEGFKYLHDVVFHYIASTDQATSI